MIYLIKCETVKLYNEFDFVKNEVIMKKIYWVMAFIAILISSKAFCSKYYGDIESSYNNSFGDLIITIPIKNIVENSRLKFELGITFSSKGRGLSSAGKGTYLNGLEQISECDNNKYWDKDITKKSLCLNGNRLFLVSGEYLKDRSVYFLDGHSNLSIEYLNGENSFYIKEKTTGLIKKYSNKSTNDNKKWLIEKRIDSSGNEVNYNYLRLDSNGLVTNNKNFGWYISSINYKNKKYEFKYSSNRGLIMLGSIMLSRGGSEILKYKLTQNANSLYLTKLDLCNGMACLEPLEIIYETVDYRGFYPHGPLYPVRDKIWHDYDNISSKYNKITLKKNSKRKQEFVFKPKRDVYDYYDLNNEYFIELKADVRRVDERVYLLTEVYDDFSGEMEKVKSYEYGEGYFDKNRDVLLGFDYINEYSYPKDDSPVIIKSEYNPEGEIGSYPKKVTTLQGGKAYKEENYIYNEFSVFLDKNKYNGNAKLVRLISNKTFIYDEENNKISKKENLNKYIKVNFENNKLRDVIKVGSETSDTNIVTGIEEYKVENALKFSDNYYLPSESEDRFFINGDLYGSLSKKYSYDNYKVVKSISYENGKEIVSTSYNYNTNGKLISKRESGYSNIYEVKHNKEYLDDLNEFYEYDDDFLISKTDSLGNKTKYKYQNVCDLVSEEIDANGLSTKYQYDNLCNLIRVEFGDGSYKKITYQKESSNGVLYSKKTESNISPTITELYNGKNEIVSEIKEGYNGESYKKLFKNSILKQEESNYHKEGDVVYWYIKISDPLQRIKDKIYPYGNVTYKYILNVIEKKDISGRVTKSTTNSRDHITTVVNHGVELKIKTDFNGKILSSGDDNYRVRNLYSPSGLLLYTWDPLQGEEWFDYDSFGHITYTRKSSGLETHTTYDRLGRVIKFESENDKDKKNYVKNYTWDTGVNGKLKLASVEDNISLNVYKYNDKSLLEEKRVVVNSLEFTTKTTYDDFGRINSVIYPNGEEISKSYNSFGYLSSEYIDGGEKLWEIKSLDPFNRVTDLIYGNGVEFSNSYNLMTNKIEKMTVTGKGEIKNVDYVYGANDNLLVKRDNIKLETNIYKYDFLDRLTTVSQFSKGKQLHDIESISYDAYGNILESDENKYLYIDINGAKRLQYFNDDEYIYDSDGNIIQYGDVNILWNDNGKPAKISNFESEVNFAYSTENKVLYKEKNGVFTYYLDYGYQITVDNGKEVSEIYTGYEENKYISITYTESGKDKKFLHSDELGSIDIITNEIGNVTHQYMYSSFGEKSEIFSGELSERVEIGYTGHRDIDEFGLVNMKGRVYDPRVKRFLSSDPLLNDYYNLQSYNRYSYVLNNPLRYVDPTGFTEEDKNSSESFFGSMGRWFSNAFNSISNYFMTNASSSYYSMKSEMERISFATGVVYDILRPSGEELSVIAGTGMTVLATPLPDDILWASGVVSYFGYSAYQKLPKMYDAGTTAYKSYKSYQKGNVSVYEAVRGDGTVIYIGITNNIERRALEHLRTKGIIIHEIPALNKLTRPDAKAVEQVLIETYGLSKHNGQLLNKINSISPKNKIYDDAIIRGKSILNEAEYGDF